MSAWRRRAIAAFPDLRREIDEPGYSVYWLFFELLVRAREAHRARDDAALKRIYGYADWCLRQRTKEPANAAAVAFYEHLFDDWELRHEVLPWLSPQVIAHIRPLWEWRLEADQLRELEELLRGRRSTLYHGVEVLGSS